MNIFVFNRQTCVPILITIVLFFSAQTSAEIPSELSYQGFLKDSNGVPIDTNVDITFSIYDSSSDGTPLWTETQTGLVVNAGIFNTELGAVTPLDLQFDIPYFLGIAVGTDPEMTPRQKLTSSAYSMRGKNRSTELTVNCGSGEKISDALSDSTPGGWRKIIVNGTCNEDVFIRRSKVVLEGGTDGKIVGQTADSAAVQVYAVHNVIVRDISISNGAGVGFEVKYGASARLQNSKVENNLGEFQVRVSYGSVLRMNGNTITTTGDSRMALTAQDGSTVRIESDNTLTSATVSGNGGTLLGIRGTTVRFYGSGNTIDNTLDDTAVDMQAGTTFRQDGGHLKVEGGVQVFNMTNVEFRDTDIVGDVSVVNFGNLRFRDQSGNPANVTVTGTIYSNGGGHVDFKSGTRLDGDVNCSGGGSKSGTPTFLNSHQTVGC